VAQLAREYGSEEPSRAIEMMRPEFAGAGAPLPESPGGLVQLAERQRADDDRRVLGGRGLQPWLCLGLHQPRARPGRQHPGDPASPLHGPSSRRPPCCPSGRRSMCSCGSQSSGTVGHLEQDGSPALDSSITAIVPRRRRRRGVPRHLLHGGQVDAQVEQVPDPGPTQVVGGGAEIWAWRPRSRQIRQAAAGLRRAN
jgi:hypothetical protein